MISCTLCPKIAKLWAIKIKSLIALFVSPRQTVKFHEWIPKQLKTQLKHRNGNRNSRNRSFVKLAAGHEQYNTYNTVAENRLRFWNLRSADSTLSATRAHTRHRICRLRSARLILFDEWKAFCSPSRYLRRKAGGGHWWHNCIPKPRYFHGRTFFVGSTDVVAGVCSKTKAALGSALLMGWLGGRVANWLPERHMAFFVSMTNIIKWPTRLWIWRRNFWRHANEFSKCELSSPTTDNLKQNMYYAALRGSYHALMSSQKPGESYSRQTFAFCSAFMALMACDKWQADAPHKQESRVQWANVSIVIGRTFRH